MILLTVNFRFQNRYTYSKRPIKRAGTVCGDSQDLKSRGYLLYSVIKIFLVTYFLFGGGGGGGGTSLAVDPQVKASRNLNALIEVASKSSCCLICPDFGQRDLSEHRIKLLPCHNLSA